MAHMLEDNTLNIYTDGSSLSKPRKGAFGILFIHTDAQGEVTYREEHASKAYRGGRNNTMELLACVEALRLAYDLPREQFFARRIWVFSDSKYVCDNESNAAFLWPKTKWAKRGGAPVANTQEWKELNKIRIKLSKIGKPVHFRWVKGHAKNEHNKRVDKIARSAAEKATVIHFSREGLRKKHSKLSTIVGCVKMREQAELIHIISSEFLPVQKKHKYRYEVYHPGGRVFTLVDFIYSNLHLKEGHYYQVRFNGNQDNPEIAEYLEEVPNPLVTLPATPETGTTEN